MSGGQTADGGPDGLAVHAGPGRATGLALLGLAAVLGVVGLRADPSGALLALPAAAVALALGVRDLALVPVLRADAGGLTVVQGFRRRSAAWADVQTLRVTRDRRSVLLEIDLGDDVLLLSRGRLGRDPHDVLPELLAVQAAARSR